MGKSKSTKVVPQPSTPDEDWVEAVVKKRLLKILDTMYVEVDTRKEGRVRVAIFVNGELLCKSE